MDLPLSRLKSFDLMSPKGATVDVYAPFDADSYPSPNSTTCEDSALNLMNLPLLGQSSFYVTDSLPVDDTPATEPPLYKDSMVDVYPPFDADSYPSPKSVSCEDSSTNLMNLPFLGESNFYFTDSLPVDDNTVTESPLYGDSYPMAMEFEKGSGVVQQKLLDIESQASDYLSTLRMMACFLPRFIGKDDIDSPYYPAPAVIREFLSSSTEQAKNMVGQAGFASSKSSRI